MAAHIRQSVLEEGHAGHSASQSKGGSERSLYSIFPFIIEFDRREYGETVVCITHLEAPLLTVLKNR